MPASRASSHSFTRPSHSALETLNLPFQCAVVLWRSVSRLVTKRLLIVVCVVVVAEVITWLVFSAASPFDNYLHWNTAIGNAWSLVNLPGSYLGVLASGNVHQPNPVGVALGIGLQWAAVAGLASLAFTSRRQAK